MDNKIKVPNLDMHLESKRRRFVTYFEGARMYSLNYYTFVNLAKKAGASYVIRKHAICDLDILDDYLKKIKEEENA